MAKLSQINGDRNFLFLQGPMGNFFTKLAEGLKSEGCKVMRINFNGGDRFYWNDADSIDFKLTQDKWPAYIADVARLRKVTDLVVYGDCRPLHKDAIAALKPLGVRVHVFEEGYIRPHWITLERDGVNAYSLLSRDPVFYMKKNAKKLPEAKVFGHNMYYMTFNTIMYFYAALPTLNSEFKNYRHHFDHTPTETMIAWIPRLATVFYRKIKAKFQQRRIVKTDYFLVPLQLGRDWQIREHSDFSDIHDFIEFVVRSFAKNAAKNQRLLFKNHPLDNGLLEVQKSVEKFAMKYDIAKRVEFIDGGHLPSLLDNCKGVITVNSTAGLSAIHHAAPTIALGDAIYNIEGLVNKCGLDEFWKKAKKPSRTLYEKFRNYISYKTQINGSFYNPKGVALAVENALDRILGRSRAEKEELRVEN
ncbi:MAG: capsular biosynthesis protein [Alphaproteobacteria bacterium CG11_big_fil_rev_8_21_14_0_20_44_7]|nr:MAG: capsular biosynthesis protein [Alphaproteobacteria bacterium CG11_big_fil_rev_8_21_14_0_20_44_7]